MTIPTPRKPPDPLPGKFLSQRFDSRWESNDRAGDAKLREIQAWAKEQLIDIFMAQELGGDDKDQAFMERVNGLYDPIRNALTRQDLIRGLLLTAEKEAMEEANSRMRKFRSELDRMMPGGIRQRRDQKE